MVLEPLLFATAFPSLNDVTLMTHFAADNRKDFRLCFWKFTNISRSERNHQIKGSLCDVFSEYSGAAVHTFKYHVKPQEMRN